MLPRALLQTHTAIRTFAHSTWCGSAKSTVLGYQLDSATEALCSNMATPKMKTLIKVND